MEVSQGCFVCLQESRISLPAHLVARLETTLGVELSSVIDGNTPVCRVCLEKLEKIEELVEQMRQTYKLREESRSVRKRKPGFELSAFAGDKISKAHVPEASPTSEPISKEINLPCDEPKDDDSENPSVRKVWSTKQPYHRHRSDNVHTCACGHVFSTFSTLTRHSTRTHGKRWVCPEKHCQESFVKRDDLNLHKSTHNKMSSLLLRPVLTDDYLTSVDSRPNDLVNAPDKNSKEAVDHSYNQKMGGHVEPVEEMKPKSDDDGGECLLSEFPCPVCDNSYQREIHLKKHVELSHWYKAGQELYCTNCNQSFGDLENMLPHAREHRRDMPKCPDCTQVFLNKPHMLRHRTQYHPLQSGSTPPPLSCNSCSLTFETVSLLSYHNLLTHAKVVHLRTQRPLYEYQCGQCNLSLPSVRDLRNHVKSCHGPATSLFECEDCLEAFTDEQSLEQHLVECGAQGENAAEITDYQLPCPVCDSVYDNVSQLEIHMHKLHWFEDETAESFICASCSLAFEEKREMIEHARTHRADMASCSRCPGSAIPNASQLNLHNLRVHSGQENGTSSVYVCGSCSEECQTLHILSYHMFTFHNQYLQVPVLDKHIFKCRQCDKSFSSTSALRSHVEKHHAAVVQPRPEITREAFICPKCGDDFEEGIVFEHHVTRCSGKPNLQHNYHSFKRKRKAGRKQSRKQPIYHCNVCGVTYRTSYSYKIHMMEHKGKSTIKCEECERTFYTYAQLKNHKLSHTKPHKCQECDASFALKAHLKDHSVIHSAADRADYRCEVCGRRFRWRYSLSRHRSTEHNIGYKYKERVCRVACKLCGSNMLINGIRRHFKNVHKNMKFDRAHFTNLPDRVDNPPKRPKRNNVNRKDLEQLKGQVNSVITSKETTQDGNKGLSNIPNITFVNTHNVEGDMVVKKELNRNSELAVMSSHRKSSSLENSVIFPPGEVSGSSDRGGADEEEQQMLQVISYRVVSGAELETSALGHDSSVDPGQILILEEIADPSEAASSSQEIMAEVEGVPARILMTSGGDVTMQDIESSVLVSGNESSAKIHYSAGDVTLTGDGKTEDIMETESRKTRKDIVKNVAAVGESRGALMKAGVAQSGLRSVNKIRKVGMIVGGDMVSSEEGLSTKDVGKTAGEVLSTEGSDSKGEVLSEENVTLTEPTEDPKRGQGSQGMSATTPKLTQDLGTVVAEDRRVTDIQISSIEDSNVRTERFVDPSPGGQEVEVVYVEGEERNVMVELPEDSTGPQIHYVITYDS